LATQFLCFHPKPIADNCGLSELEFNILPPGQNDMHPDHESLDTDGPSISLFFSFFFFLLVVGGLERERSEDLASVQDYDANSTPPASAVKESGLHINYFFSPVYDREFQF